jgi:putative oxidoreductase
MSLIRRIFGLYDSIAGFLNGLQNPLLLAIRLWFGWQYATDGWGKLTHLARVTDYFTTLNLPAPGATAFFVGLIEFAGGIFLALGLASRLTSLILFANMTVAFWTAERDAFTQFFSNSDKFEKADAFAYWAAALVILIVGPGNWALDTLIVRWLKPAAPQMNRT